MFVFTIMHYSSMSAYAVLAYLATPLAHAIGCAASGDAVGIASWGKHIPFDILSLLHNSYV